MTRIRCIVVSISLVVLLFTPAARSPITAAHAAAPSSPCITCLGSLAKVQPYKLLYDPIDYFRRMPVNLESRGKVEVLSIGILYDGATAQSTWELVKALDRFGTWSGVRFLPTACVGSPPTGCSEPSYDLTRAHYSSKLVTFVNKDVARIDGSGKYVAYQHLNHQERALYNRYSKFRGRTLPFEKKTMSPFQLARLPLLAVGRYEETRTWLNYTFGGYKVGPSIPDTPASTIQHGLIAGKDPPSAVAATPVTDINAITNILVALICHADGKRPGSVCGLSVIKSIMRHIK